MSAFTYEEECLLACFEGTSKHEVISDIESKLPYLGEEMSRLTQQALQKIKGMTAMEFEDVRKIINEREG